MKKLFFVLAVLLLPLGNAGTAEIISPEDGFQHHLNNPKVTVKIATDFDIKTMHFKVKCSGDSYWQYIITETIDSPGVKSYSTDLTIMKEGQCQLNVNVMGRPDEQGNIDSAVDTISFTGIPDFPFAVNVVRNLPKVFYPGGDISVHFNYYIAQGYDISGIIIAEKIPAGFSLAGTTSGIDVDWNPQTKTVKFLLKGTPLSSGTVHYAADVDQNFSPGTDVNFNNGTYEWLGSAQILIKEENTTKVAGFTVPGCPMTDQQFLGYVSKWSKMQLGLSEEENDSIIMQIIQVWKSC